MTETKRLGRDAAAYTIGGAFQLIATLLLLPLTTRVLRDDEFGLVVTLQLVTQVAVLLGSAGFPVATMREYFAPNGGPDRAQRLVVSTMKSGTITVVLAVAATLVWAILFNGGQVGAALWLSILVSVPRALTASGLGYLRACHDVRSFLGISILNTAGAQLVGIAVASTMSNSAADLMLGYLIGSIGAALWTWISCERPISMLRGSELRGVLRYALPFVPATLATLVLQAGDRVVIGSVLGLADVGRYQVGYLLASLAVPALVSFNNAWSPRLAQARETGSFVESLQGPANSILVAVAWLGAACSLVTPVVIKLGLPASYDVSELRVVIAVVAASSSWFAVYVIATQALVAERRTGALAIATPVAAAVNIGLNIVLLPRVGMEGAAIATTIAYAGLAIAITIVARRLHPYRLSTSSIAFSIVASGYGALTIPLGVADGSDILFRCLLTCPPIIAVLLAFRGVENVSARPA